MIINKYLLKYDSVFNPRYNYGEIMLSCITLNKRYIGICDNDVKYSEAEKMLTFLNDNGIDCDVAFNRYDKCECLLSIGDDDFIDECLRKYKCERHVFISNENTKYVDNIAVSFNNNMIIIFDIANC